MKSVFISYSHTDSAVADSIAVALDEMGIEYFRDVKNIEVGDPISASVRQGLQNASAIIVIISPGSLKSQWVAYEVGFGVGTHKRVLPYLTHPALDLPGFMSDLLYATSINKLRAYFVNNPNWHEPSSVEPTQQNSRTAMLSDVQESNAFAIRATENRIIVRPDERESSASSGLYIPESAFERICKGVVLAIGEDVRKITIGDYVIWGKYAGSDLIVDGEELLVVRENDIVGVINSPS